MDKKNLGKAIEKLLKDYEAKISNFSVDDFLKSDIDPFRFAFNAAIWGLENAVKKEVTHKIEMSLEDLFGDFHENYLGNAIHEPSGSQWEVVPKGVIPGIDIMNREMRYYLQIKSKHNSMNSSSASKLAQQLEALLKKKSSAIVGCGWVIAGPQRKCIGESDIASVGKVYKGRDLYAFVTGNPKEMDQVVAAFPAVLGEVFKDHDLSGLIDKATKTVLDDLKKRAQRRNISVTEYLYQEAVGEKTQSVFSLRWMSGK